MAYNEPSERPKAITFSVEIPAAAIAASPSPINAAWLGEQVTAAYRLMVEDAFVRLHEFTASNMKGDEFVGDRSVSQSPLCFSIDSLSRMIRSRITSADKHTFCPCPGNTHSKR